MIETKREKLNFDVVIVGAGPAGLAAAIKIRQLSSSVSVAVLEKGAEVGSHILSGAVLDPVGIDLLFPKNWRTRGDHPFKTPAKKDEFIFLGSNNSIGFQVLCFLSG